MGSAVDVNERSSDEWNGILVGFGGAKVLGHQYVARLSERRDDQSWRHRAYLFR
jgi:hypothetical protein